MAGNHDVVIVGAPNEAYQGQEAGKAYIFKRKTRQLLHELRLFRPTGGALFGQSVALSNGLIMIGAPHSRDTGGTYAGGVYVFDQLTGKELRVIANPHPLNGTFGHVLAVGGNRLVVGDPQASTQSSQYTGAAYVFDLNTSERLGLYILQIPYLEGLGALDTLSQSQTR